MSSNRRNFLKKAALGAGDIVTPWALHTPMAVYAME